MHRGPGDLTGEGVDSSSNKRIVWLLATVILLSFGFGVMMFLPAEHRAQKLEQISKEYKAQVQRMHSARPEQPSGS